MKLSKLSDRYRVEDGGSFRLKDFDPADTGKVKSHEQAQEILQQNLAQLPTVEVEAGL